MPIFASIADTVLDGFGVFDDAQDYMDRTKQLKQEARVKLKTIMKLVQDSKTDIEVADEPGDVDSATVKQAIAISEDLIQEIADVEKQGQRLTQKAQKDKELWPKVSGELGKTTKALADFSVKAKELTSNLKTLWDDHKKAVKELKQEKGEHRTAKQVAATVATVLGVIGGVLLVAKNIG